HRAVAKLNDLLYQFTSEMDRFVTLAAAVLDPERHSVTLLSAGHPSPLLCSRSTGELTEIVSREIAGVPLGMLDGVDYVACAIKLEPGDCVLLFSDGVPDSYNVRNMPFQNKGIRQALHEGRPHTPKGAGERILKAVKLH